MNAGKRALGRVCAVAAMISFGWSDAPAFAEDGNAPAAPRLRLVGTVKSKDGGFGIFNRVATGGTIRLKVGEGFEGWRLFSIEDGAAVFEENSARVILKTSTSSAQTTAAPIASSPSSVPTDRASLGIVQSPPRTPPKPTRPAMIVPMGKP
jgi:hypothetical protein